ncbi:hypothetical protein [Dasania marina]|uniref:hypothetical protein n=1 Tax=Dasania marina TaxID=471499 RepID=UPI0030D8233F|tara:strand:- start:47367 stop:48524 length:1158 start_codon:yes stop_codon:yes gene_type:complete
MFKRYFIALLVVIASVVFATAGFAWWVDPYGLYGEYTKEDSFKKPEVNNQIRLHKRAQLERNQYDALILGNSRAFRTYDPEHAFFEGYKAYNAAVSNAHINEIYYSLRLANKNTNIKKVVLVVDYALQEDIKKSEQKKSTLIFERGARSFTESAKYYKDTLLSIQALKDSLKTIFYLGDENRVTVGGLYYDQEGDENDFKEVELGYLNKYMRVNIKEQSAYGHRLYKFYFKKILSYLHEHKIDTTIVISPLHARFMEVIYSAGLWQDFSNWKEVLVAVNEEVAEEYEGDSYVLYDAAIYNEKNIEFIRPYEATKWYYESSHAMPKYGDALLNEMIYDKGGRLAVRLDIGDIDMHFNFQRAERLHYIERREEQVLHIKRAAVMGGQ